MKNKKGPLKIVPSCALLVLVLCFCGNALAANVEAEETTKVISISLADAVYLTIRNNLGVRSLYLDRVIQKFDLEKEEAKFTPNVDLDGTLILGANDKSQQTRFTTETSRGAGKWEAKGQFSAMNRLPTGAEIRFSWEGQVGETNEYLFLFDDLTRESAMERDYEEIAQHTWRVEVEQPLLKGGGVAYNMASVRLAKLQEQVNLLNLRDGLSGLINEAVTKYLAYAQAVKTMEIQGQGLERSRRLLEMNAVKVDVGRLAENDMIQAEADVASRVLSVEEAENALDEARRNLLNHLDLDPNLEVEVSTEELPESHPEMEECLKWARINNKDYVIKKLNVDVADLNFLQAANDRKWDLSIKLGYEEERNPSRFKVDVTNTDASAELTFNTPINLFGDNMYDRKRALLQAEIGKRRAKLELKQGEVDLQTSVANSVRNVNMQYKLIELATKNRELKEKQLKNEQTKLMVGRSTNFQVVTYQDQLLQAQQDEVAKKVAYVNALMQLDRLMGTTMKTWKIAYKNTEKSLSEEERIYRDIRPWMWTWW